MKAPNDWGMRAGGTLVLSVALALATPITALADPGTIDPTVSITDPTGTTGTTTATLTASTTGTTTVTATTTGTRATATAPQTVTVGSTGTVTAPTTTGVSTGSGPITTSQTVTPTGAGATSGQSVSTSLTDTASPATVYGRGIAIVDQGLNADLAASEPTSGTTLTAGAQAHAILCLLAQVSVDPSRAVLSSLCGGGPSTTNGAAQLGASNGITGTSARAAPTVRAALCLLALASSSAPRAIDARELGSASLSTLCGSAAPSTVDAAGDVHLAEDRTGTDLSAAPIAAVAACLLANVTAGTTTVAQLATLCGGAAATPSTVTGGSPIQLIQLIQGSDGTTGSKVTLAPAAQAALCLLLDALATIPSDPTDASAVAALSTPCGSSTGTNPSTIAGATPVTATNAGGTNADLSPSINAALCLLAQAGVSVATSTAQLANACGATGAGGTTTTTTTTTTGGTPTTGVPAGPGNAPNAPQGGTGVGPGTQVPQHGVLGVNTPPLSGVLGLSGLPSTATEMLGGVGLLLIVLGTSLAMTNRRRR